MRIGVLITALMLSAFAFVLLNNGGQITGVNAVSTLGESGDDDSDDDDGGDCQDPDDNYEDDWGSDDEKGDGEDEDGEEGQEPGSVANGLQTPTPSPEVTEVPPHDWDGNDDQIEKDDCQYPPHDFPADYGSCDDPPGYPGAYFYYETNYQGQCFRISGDTWFFDGDNDQASSIDLVGISSIVVCEHSSYEGVCIDLEEDVPDLGPLGRDNDLSSAYFDGAAPQPTPPGTIITSSADANCDGNVSGQDAVALLMQIGGLSEADACGAGDANCSGWIDPSDVKKVLKVVAGLETAC